MDMEGYSGKLVGSPLLLHNKGLALSQFFPYSSPPSLEKVLCFSFLALVNPATIKCVMTKRRRVHLDCINASNPYHECVGYCFAKISKAKAQTEEMETETKLGNNGKLDASSPATKNVEVTNVPTVGSLRSILYGIPLATEDNDVKEIQSVISYSCVSVGKYKVRTNTAPTLQLILDKHGDIAANCKLESTSLCAYYLECLCSVVQELRSTAFNQLKESKVKEFLAVLKDVKSAQIDVSWLLDVLNRLTEVVEIVHAQQVAKEAKANCDNLIEGTKRELESIMEDLAQKEKAVADAKARIEECKEQLRECELESAKLSESISSLSSKVEEFKSKPLAQQILK